MVNLSKRRIGIGLFLFVVMVSAWVGWSRHISPTRIAVVNFRDFQYAQMLDATESRFVRLHRIEGRDLPDTNLSRYTLTLIFGMGLRLDEVQAEKVHRSMKRGARVFVHAATGGNDEFTTLGGEELEHVQAYLTNGGRRNLQRLFAYARRAMDRKSLFASPIEPAQEIPLDALFHLEADVFFTDVNAYQDYYERQGHYREGRPRVCLLTSLVGPRTSRRESLDDLIRRLEALDLNVYPIAGLRERLAYMKEIAPDLVVYFPHGRVQTRDASDAVVAWLAERDIPLLCPIHVREPYETWVASQQGMVGGMLSQSIVMPELDGGIEPFALTAEFPDERGLLISGSIPIRMETFVRRIQNWLSLRSKPNEDKRVAIVYFKGPGRNALVASGMEVTASLLNVLRHLRDSGFTTGPLPETVAEFEALIQRQGPVLGPYAQGAFDEFVREGEPELIETQDYLAWVGKQLDPELLAQVEQQYGPAPGEYLSVVREGRSYLALPRVQFGNIVILPQLMPGLGDDTHQLVHGVKAAPPHPYIATYLWARHGFGADALIHFGTHGSLEFTPWKQTALSQMDWADALIGDLPHPYVYTINNVGEALIAKRRSYATVVTHLTPPYMESELYGPLTALNQAVQGYESTEDEALRAEYARDIHADVLALNLDKDLGFEGFADSPLTAEWIDELHDYLYNLGLEKITRGFYVLGRPYPVEYAEETARLMTIESVSYALSVLDQADRQEHGPSVRPTERAMDAVYRERAGHMIHRVLAGDAWESLVEDADLALLASRDESLSRKDPIPLQVQEQARVEALRTVLDSLQSVVRYREALLSSTWAEFDSLVRVLSGGYIAPSTGGDPIANPQAVPTGRNLTAIDMDRVPTPQAWQVGVQLAQSLLEQRRAQTGDYPQKVAVTLWGGELIRTEGTQIAMILHLLGVEPVRNVGGVVHAVRLVPMETLQRPRIDVVVQTSGQARDIGASRLFLIDEAVRLASAADDPPEFPNRVRQGTLAAEQVMKQQGLSPLDARTFATARIFGGVNGNYGTGIMGLVEAGDRWEDDQELTDQYLKNMGAIYTKEHWGHYRPGVFEAALQNTDTLIHSRSSNNWGPLSLDHVYEFMGGLNAVIRNVTGNDPDALFTDLRNRYRPRLQGVREAIWTESRTTLMNPRYITAMQQEGSSAAEHFAETFRNTYGWNVLRPAAVDTELWEGLYDVYVEDSLGLDMRAYFEATNPYALQEMSAVMLETIRKGYWQADPEVIRTLAGLHVELVRDHQPGCSGFVCDNAKLRDLIARNVAPDAATTYRQQIEQVRVGHNAETVEGMQLKKETLTLEAIMGMVSQSLPAILMLLCLVGLFIGAVAVGARRHRV